jgi:hypothetical protein
MKQMNSLPHELVDKIVYDYIPLYMSKMQLVHEELRKTDLTLHMSETIFDFEVDFCHIIRLPRLLYI